MMRNGSPPLGRLRLPDPIVLLPATAVLAAHRRPSVRAAVLPDVLASRDRAAFRAEPVAPVARQAGSALPVAARTVEQPERERLRCHGELPRARCRSSGVLCDSGQGVRCHDPWGPPRTSRGSPPVPAVRSHRPPSGRTGESGPGSRETDGNQIHRSSHRRIQRKRSIAKIAEVQRNYVIVHTWFQCRSRRLSSTSGTRTPA